MKKQSDFRVLVHTPAELAQEHLQWAETIQTDPGIQFGISCIDKLVIPMRPGDLTSIIARPSHGKTSLMAYLARQEANRIIARDAKDREAVVYVTWEQSAEELETFFQADDQYSASDVAWGRVDLDIVRKKAVQRASVPIWVIGHGIARAGQMMPRMTPDTVLGAIETMQTDFGIRPTLMLFDYVQLIPIPNVKDRVQQVTEVPIRVKELALRIGAPAVVGVQASRDVDNKSEKIPEMRDAQWSSAIEQTSDKVFGLWRPWQTEAPDTTIELFGGEKFVVNEWLLVIRLLKQRGDRGRHTWALYFEPHFMRLAEIETRQEPSPEAIF